MWVKKNKDIKKFVSQKLFPCPTSEQRLDASPEPSKYERMKQDKHIREDVACTK